MTVSAITPETVVDIFLAHGTHKAVARRFGVTPSAVRDIKQRQTHRRTTALFTPEVFNATIATVAFLGGSNERP